jgi:hypothetical protein
MAPQTKWAVVGLLAAGKAHAGDDGLLPLPLPHSVHEMGQHSVRPAGGKWRALLLGTELTPLIPGYGTHFSYVYVGTPGQRVSVIVDTGSSFTAFPCKGCQDCGDHTDSYWDMSISSTASQVLCDGQPCVVSQGYSEGSTWKAVKIKDKLFIGGESLQDLPSASSYAVDFVFGCQTSETGLFRTQLADGIMGMGISDITLPFQLWKQSLSSTKMFAMCFKKGGGILTLGGADTRIHSLLKPQLYWAKLSLVGSSGWYGVQLVGIFLVNRKSGDRQSLAADAQHYAGGEGSIVDSGTTDTYLPKAVQKKFTSIFKDLTGFTYTNDEVPLNAAKLAKIPDVVFQIKDVDDKIFEVTMAWSALADGPLKNGGYAMRIYFQDDDGAVLGANFMSNHNVIFDVDGERVGFAQSDCDYQSTKSLPPPPSPTPASSAPTAHAPAPAPPSAAPHTQRERTRRPNGARLPTSAPSDSPPSADGASGSTLPDATAANNEGSSSSTTPDDDRVGSNGKINTQLLLGLLAPFLGIVAIIALCFYYFPRSVAKQTEDLEMVQSVVFNSQDHSLNPFSSSEEGEEVHYGGLPPSEDDNDVSALRVRRVDSGSEEDYGEDEDDDLDSARHASSSHAFIKMPTKPIASPGKTD